MQNRIEDLGSSVPDICQHPGCNATITRGRVNVCGADPAGGDSGCGMAFCGAHLQGPGQTCERCAAGGEPFMAKPNAPDWLDFKLTGEAWAQWRNENPDHVASLVQEKISKVQNAKHGTGNSTKEKDHEHR